MRAPGNLLFLFLILELIPQPGVSQGGNNWKYFPNCGGFLKDANMNDRFYLNLVENATYEKFANNIVKFKLPGGIFCGERGESWVENVINCINQDRQPCLKRTEIPKGSNEKLLSTTQKTTYTTKEAPFPGQSTQTWKGGTKTSSESANKNPGTLQKTLETIMGATTTAQDLDQNNDSQHGIKQSAEKEDEKSKKKQMMIAIISLILIVLAMTAIATYFVCRKGKVTKCTTTYNTDINMVYQQPLVEEQEPGGEIIPTSCVLEEKNCLQDNIAYEVQN
ncbi:uncharacterized protein LOC143774321 [Ranitomeya variabilis]|uniref:uncharacterized protein LOC143774321 n=1 Tax=Ranitomeya variabilis TaxID=490064 RepID=UPI0040560342